MLNTMRTLVALAALVVACSSERGATVDGPPIDATVDAPIDAPAVDAPTVDASAADRFFECPGAGIDACTGSAPGGNCYPYCSFRVDASACACNGNECGLPGSGDCQAGCSPGYACAVYSPSENGGGGFACCRIYR